MAKIEIFSKEFDFLLLLDFFKNICSLQLKHSNRKFVLLEIIKCIKIF